MASVPNVAPGRKARMKQLRLCVSVGICSSISALIIWIMMHQHKLQLGSVSMGHQNMINCPSSDSLYLSAADLREETGGAKRSNHHLDFYHALGSRQRLDFTPWLRLSSQHQALHQASDDSACKDFGMSYLTDWNSSSFVLCQSTNLPDDGSNSSSSIKCWSNPRYESQTMCLSRNLVIDSEKFMGYSVSMLQSLFRKKVGHPRGDHDIYSASQSLWLLPMMHVIILICRLPVQGEGNLDWQMP